MVGWTVEQDGEIIATCGVFYSSPMQAFSNIAPEMKRYPKVILKLGKRLVEAMRQTGANVYAHADESHPRSIQFLEHLGFVHYSERVFVWEKDNG